MKKFILACAVICVSVTTYANPIHDLVEKKDTLLAELKNDIVIVSSIKETNSLKSLPGAISIFSPKSLEALQIHSLKDLSSFVPNYSVASYGSKMTAPVYIRGIGARSGSQTVSMYVDNIPYFNTTSFDVNLSDVQRVEVLRGTQSTLYGRNAMGGLLNIFTYSPLDYQGSNFEIGGGSYGDFKARASHFTKLGDKTGISASAFYSRNDGYFRNAYDNSKVDGEENAGGRIKFAWDISPRWSATLSTGLDYVSQGAFPYENTATGKISYNSDGDYTRKLLTNGLAFRYSGAGFEINSTTGYQYLNDNMNMDQDYTEQAIFRINQRQNENSLSQEFTIKSTSKSNYQWSAGLFGFYDYLKTTPPVYMMQDGIDQYLQSHIDKGMDMIKEMVPAQVKPMIPDVLLSDPIIDLNGVYRKTASGGAIFHQSTYNNLFTDGLSVTLGARLDYEKTKLDYNANTNTGIDITGGAMGAHVVNFRSDTAIVGKTSNDFFEFLPKAVIKYEVNADTYVYGSVSRGYKTGGHNIQVFADLLQEALEAKMIGDIMGKMPAGMLPSRPGGSGQSQAKASIDDRISYKPEYSLSYEIGGQVTIFDKILMATATAYYMDIKDVQITQFVNNRGGRLVANAGKARSQGIEIGVKSRPCTGVFIYANYGFSDAKFRSYDGGIGKDGNPIDYSGNYIPFAPRSTFSVGGSITYDVKNCSLMDKITLDTNYAGIGKIYWDEANTMSQGFHGDVDARLAFQKSIFTVELWGKNLLNKDYHTFVFESRGMNFGQRSKPIRLGASFKIKL